MVVLGLRWARKEFLQAVPGDSSHAEYAAWAAFTVVVATASVKWTAVFDPMAAGSGIPEMKSIISYDHREDASRYLAARTLISKIGGLALALGSGVSLGKEGPFVHTSSIIAHRLMKHVKCFHRIYDDDFMRRHVYNAACAVGVTTTFRAPIGGALFAIEVTSTIFMVSNYWRAFVASIGALLAREAVYMVHQDWVAAYRAMFATKFVAESFAFAEVIAFAVLAVFTGLLGAMYASAATAFRLRWNAWATNKSEVLTSLTLLFPLAAILCLPVGMTRLSFGDIISDLTSTDSTLPDRWHAELSLSVLITLPLATLIRLVVTAMSFSLPVPAGDFIPTFIAGATFGRFYGEILRVSFPIAGIVPGGYALAGGAGFVASTTNTTSVAVIALEFTGQFVYTIPLILSTLIASGVGCALRVSVYDSVIAKKGFTNVRTLDLQDLKAHDIMLHRFPLLTLDMTQAQLESALRRDTTPTLPLVENLESKIFIGCIPRGFHPKHRQ
ncbi:Chloride Channel (ClC) Family [Phytophthora palmivora]|uniref:Chloride Channel (ClC) Family n=1 Tax=Phytophthora palmivora TaxID=4796 RepID=A0A2P4X7S4_9STRA|nr:Chloride Channel (ClC) Family [Phytophthora palmivora]